jgi:hypothetical protein
MATSSIWEPNIAIPPSVLLGKNQLFQLQPLGDKMSSTLPVARKTMLTTQHDLEALITTTRRLYWNLLWVNPTLWPCVWYLCWWKHLSGMSVLDSQSQGLGQPQGEERGSAFTGPPA